MSSTRDRLTEQDLKNLMALNRLPGFSVRMDQEAVAVLLDMALASLVPTVENPWVPIDTVLMNEWVYVAGCHLDPKQTWVKIAKLTNTGWLFLDGSILTPALWSPMPPAPPIWPEMKIGKITTCQVCGEEYTQLHQCPGPKVRIPCPRCDGRAIYPDGTKCRACYGTGREKPR